jgi:hypothetical protein
LVQHATFISFAVSSHLSEVSEISPVVEDPGIMRPKNSASR